MAFVPSYQPFKPEKKLTRRMRIEPCLREFYGPEYEDRLLYPYEHAQEKFRSSLEVAWARAFDGLGLGWEYEPLKFDMGEDWFSYTPDFRVAGLSVPGSDRQLYVEVKSFPDDIDFDKYRSFTDWYQCDLLLLAHAKGGVLHPKKWKWFTFFRCPIHGCEFYYQTDDLLPQNYRPPYEPPHERWEHSSQTCWECDTFERRPAQVVSVRNYLLIQQGTIMKAKVEFPDRRRR